MPVYASDSLPKHQKFRPWNHDSLHSQSIFELLSQISNYRTKVISLYLM